MRKHSTASFKAQVVQALLKENKTGDKRSEESLVVCYDVLKAHNWDVTIERKIYAQ